jgi:hypothetical protein
LSALAPAARAPQIGGTGKPRKGFKAQHCNLPGIPIHLEDLMLDYRDLMQWERFITPSIIKIFYWLAVAASILFGLSGIASGLVSMFLNPLGGLFLVLGSLISTAAGVVFARIISEFFLIMFRINEHLGAIRQRGQM